MLCCPVLGPKGTTLAVIQAFHAKEHYFNERHVTMVQQLAKMAAIAFQNQSLLLAKAGQGPAWVSPFLVHSLIPD